jgi:hypothetical protein
VTHRPIARQRLGKHISAGANARRNRTYVTRQLRRKHTSSTVEAVCTARFVQSGYKEVFNSIELSLEPVVRS